jgi:large subunit ribosomal protein L18
MANVSKNFKRKRRHIRLRKKISGTAARPRLSVFRSNANIHAQIIDDVSQKTLVAASSVSLKLENGGNKDAAIAVGKAVAEAAAKAKITTVVFDRGGYIFHGRIKALADSAKENGLVF